MNQKEQMSYLKPAEIATLFTRTAAEKDRFSTGRLMVYGVLGGAFIALGGMLALMVAGGMPGIAASNPGLVKFVFGAVFPLGLFMVVIGGAELFTSDCAAMAFGVYRKVITPFRLLRAWSIVYLANFFGAFLVAYFMVDMTGILDADPWLSTSIGIGEVKTSAPFLKTFMKGVGANWLVCMAVWMSLAAKDVAGKMLAIWFPVMAFVALGMEHSIANMFFIPLAMLQGADITMYGFIVGNLLPATLGNIVGGAGLVALTYAYMFPEMKTRKIPQPNNDKSQYLIEKLTERIN